MNESRQTIFTYFLSSYFKLKHLKATFKLKLSWVKQILMNLFFICMNKK